MPDQQQQLEPSDIFLAEYKGAAGEGAIIELKMRMLADKVPKLEQYAHAKHLEDVEEQIVTLFAADVTDAERDSLRLCRQLRNKLLHCDFRSARTKLHELGAPPQRGEVRKISFGNATGKELVQRLLAGASDDTSAFEYVADLSTADGGVVGWLFELGAAGDYRQAIGVFRRTAAIQGAAQLWLATDKAARGSSCSLVSEARLSVVGACGRKRPQAEVAAARPCS
jgi:hypothetical protein